MHIKFKKYFALKNYVGKNLNLILNNLLQSFFFFFLL